MTQLLTAVPSCPGQRLSWSPLSVLYMIYEQAYSNPIAYVVHHWIWISTRGCLEHPGYRQMFVLNLSLLIHLIFPVQSGCRMEVHPESRHIIVLRRGQFCMFLSFGCTTTYANVFNILDWFDVLDDDNLPVLTEREVLHNLQAIVTDADKTDKSEVDISSFPLFLSPTITFSRLLEVLSVSSQRKIGRFGQVFASCYLKTGITNPVSKLSTRRFLSYAWMIPLRIVWRICVTTFCAGLIA